MKKNVNFKTQLKKGNKGEKDLNMIYFKKYVLLGIFVESPSKNPSMIDLLISSFKEKLSMSVVISGDLWDCLIVEQLNNVIDNIINKNFICFY